MNQIEQQRDSILSRANPMINQTFSQTDEFVLSTQPAQENSPHHETKHNMVLHHTLNDKTNELASDQPSQDIINDAARAESLSKELNMSDPLNAVSGLSN